MKRSIWLAIGLFFLLAFTAYAAQDGQPRDELVSTITAIVAGVGALVSSFAINLIKAKTSLGEENKSKLATAVTELVAVVVSVATGYALALLAQSLDLIGDASLRAMVVAMLTPVFAELRYRLARLGPAK